MSGKRKTQKSESGGESFSVRVKREVIAWFWVGLAFLLVNGAIGQARVIPSGSMENTLLVGDHLIMNRVGYDAGVPFTNLHVSLWRNPQRGQIIIFEPPYDPTQTDLIKRVIAMPGDEIDLRDGSVWINGRKLQEPYTLGRTLPAQAYEAAPSASAVAFPYNVPANCYFAMGDNRENSFDSRFWGCVPRQNILGTPAMIYLSVNASRGAWNGDPSARALAYAKALLHPGTIRWRRFFHLF